ncbi:MAG TPA: serine/threonine-protein kinase [Labilithrix sp.]|nr:serine/threonine-protein kinase [Labilithrix sp.]
MRADEPDCVIRFATGTMSGEDGLPRLLGGRYRLETLLGKGGMGVVYRGVDLVMRRAVAVKLVLPGPGLELDDELAGRFLREAKNTARLQHENIVEVFDLGRTHEGSPYFVMEFIAGHSLSTRLRRDGPLPVATTIHIARQICAALDAAHMAGVIHRDLKPANIMLVSRAGDDDFVKILDFGVSKSLEADVQDTQLTHTGMLVGTIDYMAPEQIMGRAVDGRSDVYALGVVLYRMLSGNPPFGDVPVPALMHAHLNTMPKPLIEVVPGVPNELDHIVLRCLAKKPEHRFESMGELARALTQCVHGFAEIDARHGISGALGEGLPAWREGSAPPPARLLDLEYRPDSGPFGDAQSTVALPLDDGPVVGGVQLREVPPTRGTPAKSLSFRDETVRLGNPHARQSSAPAPPAPSDSDAATRVARVERRACAACQTLNAWEAHVCRSCGSSLLAVDLPGSGRASVPPDPPRTVRTSSPAFDGRDFPVEAQVVLPTVPPARSHPPLRHAPPPQGPPASRHAVSDAPKQASRSSLWQRLLLWSGLRSR